ncbi:MAG: TrkH family potassium uptake protein [Dehalococcoidia bacterium]
MLPGDKLIKKPRVKDLSPTTFEVLERRVTSRAFSSPAIIVFVFVILALLGTLLLMAPFSHNGDGFAPISIAFFTATSAVTVTGLIVVDTASYWTNIGHGIILALVFVGGLGFMTVAAFMVTIFGQRVSISQRLLIRETLSRDQIGGLQRLSVSIVLVAITIQIVAFIAFLIRFLFIYDVQESAFQAVAMSISSFNNAGFVFFPEAEGLAAYQNDFFILGILSVSIILGTLSYWVVSDIFSKRNFRLYSLVTKIVIVMTLLLIVLAAMFIFVSEGSNTQTMADLPLKNKIAVSLFEGISGRTAGFSTINYSNANPATDVFLALMMFIGGATGSVAGGIKVTTFFIIVLAIITIIREKSHVTAFGREISDDTVKRSFAVFAVSLALVFSCVLALALTNSHILVRDLVFESFSAFGTVGLSTGASGDLNVVGRIIVAITMLMGRVGPLIVGLKMVVSTAEGVTFKYPTEPVTIG